MKLTLLSLLGAFCLAGCTLPANSPVDSTSGETGITGNWEFTLTSTTRPGAIYPFGIYLTRSGNSISGVGSWADQVFPQCIVNGILCSFPFGVLNPNLAGSVDANGNVALAATTSGSYPGSLSITTTGVTNGTISGIYTITSGTVLDQGTISARAIGILDGTYTGSVKLLSTGLTLNVTTTLTQATVSSSGFIPFSGSASITGSSCLGSAPMSTSSYFLGNQLEINLTAANGSGSILMDGTLSPDAKTLTIWWFSVGGTCLNDNGGGTLTRQ